MLKILVDADACPVKEEVYRVADRYNLSVILVANSRMRVPSTGRVKLEVVVGSFDAADDWIADHVQRLDIVVTADVLLAGRCVSKGARVLAPNGRLFTAENIGEAVATRDLLSELRGAGEIGGGPPPMTKMDRSRFLQRLDEIVNALRREEASEP